MILESIFRENDIRGTYPEELNESVIKEVAKGIAKKCFQEDVSSIVVARDGRLSGESLLTTFCEASQKVVNKDSPDNLPSLATTIEETSSWKHFFAIPFATSLITDSFNSSG